MESDAKLTNLMGVKEKIDVFIGKHQENIEVYSKHLITLREKAESISDSWTGSWAGFHSSLYYGNFEKPALGDAFNIEWGSINGYSDKWTDRSYEVVKARIEKGIVKTNLDYLFERAKSLVKEAKSLKEYVTTELSYVNIDTSLNDEKEIVNQIKDMGFGLSADKFIASLRPSQAWTRDSMAASQGMTAPPHIKYKAQVMSILSMISDVEQFTILSARLIRQLEIKFQLDSKGPDFVDSLDKLKVLCTKFHSVARQLQNRHDSRPTLEINDEYDVQDLFHALLKIYFDDIRSEEWVPSYAGSSSRVDFLLKNDKMVVEVKKTSSKLKDREIGEQLILDIAKYKSHPDCHTLVCFIYDPEGKIGNPEGLIADLAKQSTADLSVVVIINPLQ